jgi:hypothetical protein
MRQTAPLPAALADLAQFLDAFPGTQRELLAALQADWLGRLASLGDHRAEACGLIRRKVASPKLTATRDALLAGILGS